MSGCNLCHYEELKKRLRANPKNKGKRIRLVPDPCGTFHSGVRAKVGDSDAGAWYAWMPEKCEC